MADGTEVGKAYVSLEADSSALNAGLKAGEQKVEQFASTTETATKRGAKGFAGLGKGIKDTIRPLTSLVGGVTAAIGTFGLFVSIGERLGRAITGVVNDKGQTQEEVVREQTANVFKSAIQAARGGAPRLDSVQEALYEQAAALDEEKIRRGTIGSRFQRAAAAAFDKTGGTGATKGLLKGAIPNAIRAFYRDPPVSDLEEQQRDLGKAASAYALSRRRKVMSPIAAPPAPLSGLFVGGDPNVLRMLQSIDRQLQRRGIDE